MSDFGPLSRDGRGDAAQTSLDVGQDCLATADREPQLDGSARFADDDAGTPDAGEQAQMTPEELAGQADLFGRQAAVRPEWEAER